MKEFSCVRSQTNEYILKLAIVARSFISAFTPTHIIVLRIEACRVRKKFPNTKNKFQAHQIIIVPVATPLMNTGG